MVRETWIAWFLLLLCGCQMFNTVDTQATLSAENGAFMTEAAAIGQTAQAERQQVIETAQAAETYVFEVNNINRQLLATVRAGDMPTPGVVINAAPVVTAAAGGGTQFVQIVTASSVRDADGCADGVQSRFAANTTRIYVVARALNIRKGTNMSVEWFYEGQQVVSDSWTVPGDSSDFCLWFYIEPSDVAFSTGNWSVRLSADGAPIEPTVSFAIVDQMN